MKVFASGLIMLFLMSSTAFAACEHYAGHFDLEGKIGNTRNLGEASAFLPIACTQDRLLFTDLKFRADNLSNREANIGLGGRIQREDGIAGGYIYFDRKKSGETDKFYNQITTGAEWLADHWETRANVYIPLNGSKTIGSGVVVSDPYLAGTGIFIDRGGFQIKETPMYGADAEIGFKTTENLWLYGGGFTFHGNDVPTITGARVRAKYDLTDKVSLNAEGQYDDERGRQGWLGARLSVPFGNATATRSRMTQSPVRDVDIVTQAKTTFEPQTTTALANPDSGDAQRVIYVDNRAAANGDGSLEKPYNTLVDAQGDLRDYDIVYVFHGDGTTTGQDQGFVIDKNNVSFVGEGSPLTFAGHTLRAAGDKPLITNTQARVSDLTGNGLLVTATGTSVQGVAIEATNNHGVFVYSDTKNLQEVTLANLRVRDVTGRGINAVVDQAGHIENLIINNSEVRSSGATGVSIDALSTGVIAHSRVEDVISHQNQGHGLSFSAHDNGGTLENIFVKNVQALDNATNGIIISAGGTSSGHGFIHDARFENIVTSYNQTQGVRVRVTGAGAEIGSLVIKDYTSVDNGAGHALRVEVRSDTVLDKIEVDGLRSSSLATGLSVLALARATLNSFTLKNSDITNSGEHGIHIDKRTNNAFNIHLGPGNRIFGNGASDPNAYQDLFIRSTVAYTPIQAQETWWGQAGGALPSQIYLNGSSDLSAILDLNPLDADPRP